MTRLVRYAGFDVMEHPPIPHGEMVRRGQVAAANRRRHALRLFRRGADTLQIAKHMNVSEAAIVRWLDKERNREYAEKHA